jgi:hypothetical protein
MALINVRNKKDLITIDLRLNQIRRVINYFDKSEAKRSIEFVDMSRDDSDAYEYLLKHDKKAFFESLIEQTYAYTGENPKVKDLKIVKL